MGRSGIYVASKAHHGPMWRDIRRSGHPIISTWIDESEKGMTTDWPDLWLRCQTEAADAQATIVYRKEGETLKRALIEVGCALTAGKPVFAVGPMDGSWHSHPLVTRCETLDEAFALALATPTSDPQKAESEQRVSFPYKVPEGFKLVPVEPAEAMLDAATSVDFQNEDERAMACNIWNVMLATAPRPSVPTAPASGQPVTLTYTNWRGETAERSLTPTGHVLFTDNTWHPEPQWLLEAHDARSDELRLFALTGFGKRRYPAIETIGWVALGVLTLLGIFAISILFALLVGIPA